jgi:predicted transcriptional regulator
MTSATIQLPDNLMERAVQLARATNRSVEDVLSEAVADGLAYDRRLRTAVAEGRKSAAKGPLVPAAAAWESLAQKGMLSDVEDGEEPAPRESE